MPNAHYCTITEQLVNVESRQSFIYDAFLSSCCMGVCHMRLMHTVACIMHLHSNAFTQWHSRHTLTATRDTFTQSRLWHILSQSAPNLVVPTCRCGNTGGTIYTNMLHSSAGLNESTVDSATCRNATYNKSKWQTKSVHIQSLSSTFSLAQNADSLINQAPHINTRNESSMYYKTSTLTINL